MTRAGWLLRLGLASTLVACAGGDGTTRPDARPLADAATVDTAMGGDGAAPYRRTITLDGTDDFTADESFPTTSASFGARVTWDDANLYIGYSGPDLATSVTDAGTKWLLVYLDTTAGGSPTSETYNTQGATFPTGFAAEVYLRYKVDGTLTSLQRYETSAWVTSAQAPAVAQAGTFVELSIPRSALGVTGTTLGVVSWMINEKDNAEGSFAGLYSDNFTDGYAANLALTRYLEVDFASSRVPADPAARKP